MQKLVKILSLACLIPGVSQAKIIAFTSFENPSAIAGHKYYDSDNVNNHILDNHPDEPIVTWARTGGEIGFSTAYFNTRNSTGLSDGDYIGVQSSTGTVGSFTDGSQGYGMSDPDGLLELTTDVVDINGFEDISLSFDYFLAETGWESNDLLNIFITLNGFSYSIFNTAGMDIDNLGIEGAWRKISYYVGMGQTMSISFQFDANSIAEEFWLDNIAIEGKAASVVPEPANLGLMLAGLIVLGCMVRLKKYK